MKNKTAFVTGGAAGIGRASALAFSRKGANVFIIDKNEAGGGEVAAKILSLGGKAEAFTGDITDESDVIKAVERCADVFGGIDYAHNNAGIVISATTADCTQEVWDRIINTNLKGCWLCMKHEIRQMLKQGHGGIVNTSSISGIIGRAGDMPYTVSKFGIIGLTKSAALEYADKNIRINCVCPGAVQTSWVKRVTKGLNMLHPMNRIGQPEEIAASVIFLCSEDSSFITGHNLVIDGGRTAGEW